MDQLELPAAIVALGPGHADLVRALVADAELRQEVETEHAVVAALRVVPRPFRGLARKVLLG